MFFHLQGIKKYNDIYQESLRRTNLVGNTNHFIHFFTLFMILFIDLNLMLVLNSENICIVKTKDFFISNHSTIAFQR